MSILGLASLAATTEITVTPEVVLLLLSAASVGVAVATRVFPPRRVSGRERIPQGRPAAPLVAIVFGGMGAYFFTISALYSLWNRGASPATAPATEPVASAAHVAILSTVPALVAFGLLVLGDRVVGRVIGLDLGFDARRLPRGVFMGLLGAFIIVPPLYLLSQAVEMIYRGVHYQHEAEHPLLKTLGERPGTGVMVAIIFGACVLAPLFEELLFRGHIQTLLKRLLRSTWAAILLTSAIFTLVHPVWSWPIIFTLALCLGYAYERTGNLWVSITIHALFNSVSTALFLSGLYSH